LNIKCIYKITNLENGLVYVGSTVNFNRRKRCHLRELRNNKHSSKELQADFNCLDESWFQFDILELVYDSSTIFDRERYWIKDHRAMEESFGYNKNLPTEGGYSDEFLANAPLRCTTRRRVKNISTGEVYESIMSANREVGTDMHTIRKSIKENRVVGSYQWVEIK